MSRPSLTPSATELAVQISKDTAIVSDYLQSLSLPPLSLAEDALPFFPGTGPSAVDLFPVPPKHILEARDNLRQSCETLGRLAATPSEALIADLATAHHHSSVPLQYAIHHSIAEAVPHQESISFRDLANKVGVDENKCTRLLRMLMTHHVFNEPTPGMVGHTSMSKLLTLPPVRNVAGYLLEEGFRGAPLLCETFEKFKGSEERHHSAWNVGHGTSLAIFDFFETSPQRRSRFLAGMDALGDNPLYHTKHLANGYDWEKLGKGTLVDIGGSTGHVSMAISKVAPHLDFVVQDLDKVVEEMRSRTAADPPERVSWEVHNFFKTQPIQEAPAYLLRWILHDYSDKYAAQILQAIVPAMGPQSRILLVERIMPPPNTVTKVEERFARYVTFLKALAHGVFCAIHANHTHADRSMDMEMMLTYNAVERDQEGWDALFAKADKRLECHRVITLPGGALSVIELMLDPTES